MPNGKANNRLGATMAGIRKRRGLSRPQVATLMCIKPEQYSKIEIGRNKVPAKPLLRFIKAMGCQIDDFLDDGPVRIAPRNQRREQFLAMFDALHTKSEEERLLAAVRAMMPHVKTPDAADEDETPD